MAEHDNLAFLELVHETDARTKQLLAAIEKKIELADGQPALVSINGLNSIHLLLSIQNDLMKRLVEERESIMDHLDGALKTD